MDFPSSLKPLAAINFSSCFYFSFRKQFATIGRSSLLEVLTAYMDAQHKFVFRIVFEFEHPLLVDILHDFYCRICTVSTLSSVHRTVKSDKKYMKILRRHFVSND